MCYNSINKNSIENYRRRWVMRFRCVLIFWVRLPPFFGFFVMLRCLDLVLTLLFKFEIFGNPACLFLFNLVFQFLCQN